MHEADDEELDEEPTVPRSRPDLVGSLITEDTPDDPLNAKKPSRAFSVRNANFETEVLIPRRIKISTTYRSIRDPFKHFDTLPPSRGVGDRGFQSLALI